MLESKKTILVDLFGGDNDPALMVSGAVKALDFSNDLNIILLGNEKVIKDALLKLTYDEKRISIQNCSEVITNYDNPLVASKTKVDSSLVKGMMTIANDENISALVSVGSTGALITSSIIYLKRIGKIRPALASMLIGEKGHFCVVDCGANIDSKPEHLVDFAKMGSTYVEIYNHIDKPRVGLLSNGSEPKKGNELTKTVHGLLTESNLNFIGNIEGKNILSGDCDVLVCDGFDGNIILKNIEGTAKTIIKDLFHMKKEANDIEKVVIDKIIKELLAKYDFNSLGGAVLLGVNKIIIKAHGAADEKTIYNTIIQAFSLAKNELISHMKEKFIQ